MEENVGVKEFMGMLLDAGAERICLSTYADVEHFDMIVSYKFTGMEYSRSVSFKNNKPNDIDRDRVADVFKRISNGAAE